MPQLGKEGQWLKGLVEWQGHPSKEHGSKPLYAYFNINQIVGIRRENEDDFLLWLIDGTTIYMRDCTWTEDLSEIAPEEV